MYNYRVCTHNTFTSLPTCSYLHELMFRALNTVIITSWTLGARMCKHTPSEDGQHTDQDHTTQRELDYEWITLGYDTCWYLNTSVPTQHRPAAHPVPCPPLQSTDQTTSPPPYPSWEGEELVGGLCLSLLHLPAVPSPAKCQNSHRHHDGRNQGDGRDMQSKQKLEGWLSLGTPNKQRN